MNQPALHLRADHGNDLGTKLDRYLAASHTQPLFLCGDASEVLRSVPSNSIDFCMTSPPYWGQRDYGVDGIGLESSPEEYIDALVRVFAEVYRILKPTGSFWLNLGDAYSAKSMIGLPWRVAIRMTDQLGFIMRNDVIWHKVKGGMDQSKDKLRNVHEHIFHFTKSRSYFYDADALRTKPRASKVVNGRVISATGVSGIRYRRQIELSTALSPEEKTCSLSALENELRRVGEGEISDFRMVIRGSQRATHSDGEGVSGRARELVEKGFYFLRYHPNGAKMSDVWEIVPEDTKRSHRHFAAYPEDLCKRPISCSCPVGGLVLDPFCGTGTTMRVAHRLGRRSIGIDLSSEYLEFAEERCAL
ncbi:site-specific DNA-methyltransferase [Phenylobacterium sp.]|uniref:DNA-methyltransferase n=1 Tax=Phenylobacterium sp. TaxID=1871053 RepID=UPI002D138DE2|nr:site-specific DNA-methyltransferase [Phenylobacterium sp.]HLZ77088.1 site-specific DNA-methyltransferase [Phenylobacterium sp.]